MLYQQEFSDRTRYELAETTGALESRNSSAKFVKKFFINQKCVGRLHVLELTQHLNKKCIVNILLELAMYLPFDL